jgi:hypothetical protein
VSAINLLFRGKYKYNMSNPLFEVEYHDINPFEEVVYVHDHSEHNMIGELHTRERGVEAVTYAGSVDREEKFDLRDVTKVRDAQVKVEWGFHKGEEFDEVLHVPINISTQPILANLVLVYLLKTHDVGYVTLGKINDNKFMKLEDFCDYYL